ncbi:MAG: hypothetical protein Q8850_02785 [Candidatus Phytoplasma australasiaticum]|nr:hypothetical protein [Candidatus Phytoplasma australasiaticum]
MTSETNFDGNSSIFERKQKSSSDSSIFDFSEEEFPKENCGDDEVLPSKNSEFLNFGI